jgi:GntR family transcriptional regulator
MQISLDFYGKAPIYAQIVGQVKELVVAGVLKPGDQLPTVRELAAELRINFNTVARAYRLLHEEGVISTQQGRGTYVLEPPPPAESAHLRHAHLMDMIAGWLAEAERMGFRPEEVERAWNEKFVVWAERPEGRLRSET